MLTRATFTWSLDWAWRSCFQLAQSWSWWLDAGALLEASIPYNVSHSTDCMSVLVTWCSVSSRVGNLGKQDGSDNACYDSEITNYYFCHILFITSNSLYPIDNQMEVNLAPPFERKNVKEFADIKTTTIWLLLLTSNSCKKTPPKGIHTHTEKWW